MTQHSQNGEGVERDMSGETVLGFRVAAYRETHPEHGDAYGHTYSEHWSTPNSRDSRVKVERLFTEDQLRQSLAREPATADVGREFRRLHEAAKGCEFDLTPADGAIARLTLFVHENGDAIAAALSRAAPSSERTDADTQCTCQRYPTHCANDCPKHGDLAEHQCWSRGLGRLSHRHWFAGGKLQPTCERCGTPIDREHKEVGPVSWDRERSVAAASSEPAIAEGERVRNLEAQRQTIEACGRVVDRIRDDYAARVRSTNGEHNEDADAVVVAAKIGRAVRALCPNEALATTPPTTNDAIPAGMVPAKEALRRWHRDSCYPDAMDFELESGLAGILAALSAAPSAPATEAGEEA